MCVKTKTVEVNVYFLDTLEVESVLALQTIVVSMYVLNRLFVGVSVYFLFIL